MGRMIVAMLVLVGLSGCAAVTPVQSAGSQRIDDRFARGGASFSTGTVIDLAMLSRPEEGRLALCGAWVLSSPAGGAELYADLAVASGQVQMAKRTVLRDLTRFPRLADGQGLEGAEAACLRTAIAWLPEMVDVSPSIRFVRQVFDLDEERGGSGGIIFRGRPTALGTGF